VCLLSKQVVPDRAYPMGYEGAEACFFARSDLLKKRVMIEPKGSK
jgi:hypothetical protein